MLARGEGFNTCACGTTHSYNNVTSFTMSSGQFQTAEHNDIIRKDKLTDITHIIHNTFLLQPFTHYVHKLTILRTVADQMCVLSMFK